MRPPPSWLPPRSLSLKHSRQSLRGGWLARAAGEGAPGRQCPRRLEPRPRLSAPTTRGEPGCGNAAARRAPSAAQPTASWPQPNEKRADIIRTGPALALAASGGARGSPLLRPAGHAPSLPRRRPAHTHFDNRRHRPHLRRRRSFCLPPAGLRGARSAADPLPRNAGVTGQAAGGPEGRVGAWRAGPGAGGCPKREKTGKVRQRAASSRYNPGVERAGVLVRECVRADMRVKTHACQWCHCRGAGPEAEGWRGGLHRVPGSFSLCAELGRASR